MRYVIAKRRLFLRRRLLGGSVHDYERGKDPFSRECMPVEFQDQFLDVPAATGWLALDWCGNVIAFAQDGNVISANPFETMARNSCDD